jgi:hypothetical protein
MTWWATEEIPKTVAVNTPTSSASSPANPGVPVTTARRSEAARAASPT